MSSKKPISRSDRTLFRERIDGVRRLRHDRVPPAPRRPAPAPIQTRLDEEEVLRDLLSDHHDPAELETGEELCYARPGIQHGTLRKLRRGQYSVSQELDLHGMTVPIARETLVAFLRASQHAGDRCVRIIHGKGRRSPQGQPVLKVKLNHWLRQWDAVQAFCSARPVDGGTGAIYVLLKRGR